MILERLKEYIDSKGITIAAFERSVGMSNASFGKSLKQGMSIGSDKLEKILSVYTDLSAEWLVRGTGNMICTRFATDEDALHGVMGKTVYPHASYSAPAVSDNRSSYRTTPDMEGLTETPSENTTQNDTTVAARQENTADNSHRIAQLEQELSEIKALLQNLLTK